MGCEIVLNCESDSIQFLAKRDKRLAKVISEIGDIAYTTHSDSYHFLVGQVINQMLSNKAADVIHSRLVRLCNGNLTTESISLLSDLEIRAVGISQSKIGYIRAITQAVANGQLNFSTFQEKSDAEVIKELTGIRGIGKWTAKMYLIFVLDRPDVLPFEDVAFQQSYKWLYKTEDVSRVAIENKCKKWKPYSSIASRNFYRALDAGMTKEEFHLYK